MSVIATAKVIDLVPAPAKAEVGLCPWEDSAQFEAHRNEFRMAYAPQGPSEVALVERLVWIEWRRLRLRGAEAAVHVSHAFDRASDSSVKVRTLNRAGVTDHKIKDDVSISEILRETDADDQASVAAISEGIGDVEATMELIGRNKPYEAALARLDDDMLAWWKDALEETRDDGSPSYQPDAAGLERFLATEGLTWRKRWLAVNEVRPAIRAQAIAESFDPPRIRQLWEMESRLDRQFEKALSMLLRLQELRMVAGPAS